LAGTSLDNQIVTYAARDRFRQNRKKTFKARTLFAAAACALSAMTCCFLLQDMLAAGS
jgi:hypothetical protein